MIQEVKAATKSIRHWMVRQVAPKLYQDATDGARIKEMRRSFSAVPRPAVIYASNKFNNKPIVGAEIGVHMAINAENMTKHLNFKRLWLIDPYIEYGGLHGSLEERPRHKTAAVNRMKRYPQAKFIFKKSHHAAKHIPDETLDFLYVDGDHSFQGALRDLVDYYPKIKHGGIMAGHDFTGDNKGVPQAVCQFTNHLKLDLYARFADWWIIRQ